MQQQKQQQIPINLEPGGMIGVFTTAPPKEAAGFPKAFIFFAGTLAGLALGIAGVLLVVDRQISEAKDTAKLEQLQRQQLQKQIDKFCSENQR